MRAMQLSAPNSQLALVRVPIPDIIENQVLVKVNYCGVCRTDLHVLDGELPNPVYPIIPGHQVVGQIEKVGSDVSTFKTGDRVGIPWLGSSCGHCGFCQQKQENLCDDAEYTGFQINGGFAEYIVANPRYCFPIPSNYPDAQAAPLLCAGLIGYRCLTKAGACQTLGLYGFGAAAHLLIQVAKFKNIEPFVFTKSGDVDAQEFAKKLGAKWVGDSQQSPPISLDAAIIFAPVGELVPLALNAVGKGGTVVCGGIHMSDIPSFPYELLWGERCLRSVANLTRADGEEFLALAPKIPIKTQITEYSLEEANQALEDLRNGRFTGAAVIKVSD